MEPQITRIKAPFQRPVETPALQPSMNGTRGDPQASRAEIFRNGRPRASRGGHLPTQYDLYGLAVLSTSW